MSDTLSDLDRQNLGPLAALVGVWEGDKGDDVALGDDRQVANSKFRERLTFTSIGRVDNHEQIMYGLEYSILAWRLGAADPFHREVGYWLWDPGRKEVMRCTVVPRAVMFIAGGAAEPGARELKLSAKLGSPTYGVLSNPFLDAEFKTVAFEMTLVCDGETLRYDEDTVIQLKGKSELFHHRDGNTLRRA